MGEKVSSKERAESLRKVYALAQKNKSEDRLTQADIKQAKKVLNYKEPKKAADYSGIKDYGELSKGGQIKPVKAVLGLGVIATKKGRETLKKFFKGKKEVLSSAPGMAAVPKTMNKGGGMDMGKKEEPTQWITRKEKPTQWITKKEKPKKWITKKSRGGGMDFGQMPNTVKPRPRGNPGIVENVVGKGGDYIKDLID